MALPKRKFSRGRRDKRRANWRLTLGSLTRCPQCAKAMRPHRVCPGCGFYRGRQVVVVREQRAKKAASAA